MENNGIVITFSNSSLNEVGGPTTFLSGFKADIKRILRGIFGVDVVPYPVTIRGTMKEANVFKKALVHEGAYMKVYRQFGLTDPRTLSARHKLQDVIKDFELTTGIRWPLV